MLGAIGSTVMAPYRGDELDPRHLKTAFDLGNVCDDYSSALFIICSWV